MADTQTYYDSPLTGEELDAALSKLPQIDTAVQQTADNVALAQSWARGGTGARQGEDLDNARYWAQQAQTAVNGALGWYADEEQLKAVCPDAENGQWAIVGGTDTMWLWDDDRGWLDTGKQVDLSDYYTKGQTRGLVAFLYKAIFGLSSWTPADNGFTQTVALTAADGGPAVTASSTLLPVTGMDNTLPAATKNAMRVPARKIGAAAKTLGAGVMTVTLDEAPAVDVELYFAIKQGVN